MVRIRKSNRKKQDLIHCSLFLLDESNYEAAQEASSHGQKLMNLTQKFGFSIIYLTSIFSEVVVKKSDSGFTDLCCSQMVNIGQKLQDIGFGDKVEYHQVPIILERLAPQFTRNQRLVLPVPLTYYLSTSPSVDIKREETKHQLWFFIIPSVLLAPSHTSLKTSINNVNYNMYSKIQKIKIKRTIFTCTLLNNIPQMYFIMQKLLIWVVQHLKHLQYDRNILWSNKYTPIW